MRAFNQGALIRVVASAADVYQLKSVWPCSGLSVRATGFLLDARTGDLVDLWGQGDYDGDDLLALSHDASNYAAKRFKLPALARP